MKNLTRAHDEQYNLAIIDRCLAQNYQIITTHSKSSHCRWVLVKNNNGEVIIVIRVLTRRSGCTVSSRETRQYFSAVCGTMCSPRNSLVEWLSVALAESSAVTRSIVARLFVDSLPELQFQLYVDGRFGCLE